MILVSELVTQTSHNGHNEVLALTYVQFSIFASLKIALVIFLKVSFTVPERSLLVSLGDSSLIDGIRGI